MRDTKPCGRLCLRREGQHCVSEEVQSELLNDDEELILWGTQRRDRFPGKKAPKGTPGWLSGLQRLPSAQGVVILESQDRVPCRAPCKELASPSACVSASLCMSHE